VITQKSLLSNNLVKRASMTKELNNEQLDILHRHAYEAADEGRLRDASQMFSTLIEYAPEHEFYHYMLGLVYKYLRDWRPSLEANLCAIKASEEKNEGAIWNAAIAATALGDWQQARAMWQEYGISIPEGNGPIDADFGICCVRLNPWGNGETLYARRIDPARTLLMNVPLPESGYRWGDIVLNDGASTGQREYGEHLVPVFNAMQLLQRSEFETFAVFIGAETQEDLDALLNIQIPGLGHIEDWTDTVHHLCLRCSYGAPHQNKSDHETQTKPDNDIWNPARNLGVAAQSHHTVNRLLDIWTKGGPGRWVDAIEQCENVITSPEDGTIWWHSVDNDQDDGDEEK
jgi:tetratricopeptide (TPR) repeat protein